MTDPIEMAEYMFKKIAESEVPKYYSLFLKKTYDSLLEVGFSEEQAMNILTSDVMLKAYKEEL